MITHGNSIEVICGNSNRPLAEQVVSRIVAIRPKMITVDDVLNKVAKHYSLSEKMIVAQNRSREVAQARHIAIYLSKQLTNSSLSEIGYKMGRRTHATVLHSLTLIKEQMEFDAVLRQHLHQFESSLTN